MILSKLAYREPAFKIHKKRLTVWRREDGGKHTERVAVATS